jgi:hypothetical protein
MADRYEALYRQMVGLGDDRQVLEMATRLPASPKAG